MANKNLTETQKLEKHKVALRNVVKNPQIAEAMAAYGYIPEEIAVGQGVYDLTFKLYDINQIEDNETLEARTNFYKLRNKLNDIHRKHRKLAKIVFAGDPVVLDKLHLLTYLPSGYSKWLIVMKSFYGIAVEDKRIQERLARFRINPEELMDAYRLIAHIEDARDKYVDEMGESQDATQAKDQAFGKLDEWMSDFYAVAKIALEDHPQLLEALGVLVRN